MYPRGDKPFSEWVSDSLKFHKDIGFDALDFSLTLVDFKTDDAWHEPIEAAVAASENVGIKFEICHLPFSTKLNTHPDFVPIFNEQMHRAIDAARALGVSYAVLHPNTTSVPMEKFDISAERESVLSHLSPFAEHAARVGLNIVVENTRLVHGLRPTHRYCQTPEELCDIADALGIGICWDFGHANLAGLKQSRALEYVGRRLKVLHVNDNSGHDDEHIIPFCGNVDWKDAMHGLSLAGFNGLFNYELSHGRIPNELREDYSLYSLATAKKLLTYIE